MGGDWYDAFSLPEGPVWLAVGDVGGHGVLAASVMGNMRSAVRTCAFAGLGPAETMGILDRLLAGTVDDIFVTAVIAVYDPATGRLAWTNAGHLPPISSWIPTATPPTSPKPMGPCSAWATPAPTAWAGIDLAPRSMLAFYTDGLVEKRRMSLIDGLDRTC